MPTPSHCCAERRENHQLNRELPAENLIFQKEAYPFLLFHKWGKAEFNGNFIMNNKFHLFKAMDASWRNACGFYLPLSLHPSLCHPGLQCALSPCSLRWKVGLVWVHQIPEVRTLWPLCGTHSLSHRDTRVIWFLVPKKALDFLHAKNWHLPMRWLLWKPLCRASVGHGLSKKLKSFLTTAAFEKNFTSWETPEMNEGILK